MIKNEYAYCRLMVVKIMLLLGGFIEASGAGASSLAPKVFRDVNQHVPYEPKNLDRRVTFKKIGRGGVTETTFERDSMLSQLSVPKTIARYPVRPKNVVAYGEGWKGSPLNTADVRQAKGAFLGRYGTTASGSPWLLSLQEHNDGVNQLAAIHEKKFKELNAPAYYHDPELGKLIWSPVENDWRWLDNYGHSFMVHPAWLFDQQQWNEHQKLLWLEQGRNWLKNFIDSFDQLYTSGASGEVVKVEPIYSVKPGDQDGAWLFTRQFKDTDGNIWRVHHDFFDEDTGDLNEEGRELLDLLVEDMQINLSPAENTAYGRDGVWLLRRG